MDKQSETIGTTAVEPGSGSDDVYVGEKQGTLRDIEHMKRLGKDQVFRVGFIPPSFCSDLTLRTEKLRLLEYLWIRHDSDEHLAGPTGSRRIRTGKWRLCWPDLHVYHRRFPVRLCQHLDG